MTLLRKTATGQAEVGAKAHALPPRARSLLIMIDGKRQLADLRAMLGATVDESADLLLREGLVERLSTAPEPAPNHPTSAPAVPVPAPPAMASAAAADFVETELLAPAPPIDWRQLSREASRAINEALGPLGDELALRLERAKSEDELRVSLRRAADLLDIGASREQAERFRQRFLAG